MTIVAMLAIGLSLVLGFAVLVAAHPHPPGTRAAGRGGALAPGFGAAALVLLAGCAGNVGPCGENCRTAIAAATGALTALVLLAAAAALIVFIRRPSWRAPPDAMADSHGDVTDVRRVRWPK